MTRVCRRCFAPEQYCPPHQLCRTISGAEYANHDFSPVTENDELRSGGVKSRESERTRHGVVEERVAPRPDQPYERDWDDISSARLLEWAVEYVLRARAAVTAEKLRAMSIMAEDFDCPKGADHDVLRLMSRHGVYWWCRTCHEGHEEKTGQKEKESDEAAWVRLHPNERRPW